MDFKEELLSQKDEKEDPVYPPYVWYQLGINYNFYGQFRGKLSLNKKLRDDEWRCEIRK